MSRSTDELQRLSAANPIEVEPERSQAPAARTALASILADPIEGQSSGPEHGRRRIGRSSRRVSLVLIGVVLVGGTAVGATDPLGWWSSNPGYAKYRASTTVHVRTPSAKQLACSGPSSRLHCVPATIEPGTSNVLVNGHRTTAQLYTWFDAVRAPAHGLTRTRMLAAVAKARKSGTMSAAVAARFRHDFAAVPDSFFTELQNGMRYGTYGAGGQTRHGLTLLPPSGTPVLIICQPAAGGLSCRDLNGDERAPIGAGIYGAEANRSWRYRRVPAEVGGLPPGISFTKAEYRVLIDIFRVGTTVQHSTQTITVQTTPASPATSRRSGTTQGM